MRGVKLNYKRGLMAVLLIICFLVSVSGVSAAKLIDNGNKVVYKSQYGYQKDSWKTYSYGSNHVIMKKTCKYVYNLRYTYYSYTYDFKKISKTKMKLTSKSKYSSYSTTVYTKLSSVSFYKKYRKYYI